MEKFGVGQSVTRKEDNELLTGAGIFQDDLNLEGQLYAVFLRSPYAHANIENIDITEAKKMDGVVAIFTGKDLKLDGIGTIPCVMDEFVELKLPDGQHAYYPPNALLPDDRVRHVGEAVVMIIADTPDIARNAAEIININYNELKCVVDTNLAESPDCPNLWPEAPNNLSFVWEQGNKIETQAAFQQADKIVSVNIVNSRVIVNPIETRGALAIYDQTKKRYTLYTNTQHPFETRSIIAGILNINVTDLRVVSPHLGGGFGMKHMVHPEQPLVAWAAYKISRPIKWMGERSESFVSDTQARDHVTQADLALDSDAQFIGLRVKTTANLGAYVSNLGPVSPTILYTRMLANTYKTPAIYAEVRGVFTNTVFTDAYRGAGIPECTYLIERLVEEAARQTKLDSVEIRRRNIITSDCMPYMTPLDLTYDCGDFEKNMDDCISLADWYGFAGRRAISHENKKLRGIGMALYVESTVGDPNESVKIAFNADDTVTLTAGTKSSGQGHSTVFAQFLNETLGIPFEKIIYRDGDSDTLEQGGGSGGSRSTYMVGSAIKIGSDKIIDKAKRITAHLFETSVEDIRFTNGVFSIAGTDRSIDIMELAAFAREEKNLPDEISPGLNQSSQSNIDSPTFPNGCHICEVEVDPDTGHLSIESYSAVNDFGRVVNPKLLEGQVHGGLAQGLGQAIYENCVYDSMSGQLLSGSFMDYCMPRADNMPDFFLTTNEVLTNQNSFGVKGCGEAGAIPSVPAITNAVLNALSPHGITHIDMPLTPERIWDAIQSQKI